MRTMDYRAIGIAATIAVAAGIVVVGGSFWLWDKLTHF